ncbi:sensor histidine kinase [Agromyces neolithicus]|uniref:sensor histidine kinase n=1 Tax=Agromyces neolithicus TaxID=269420 RepID=UPI0031D25FA8
MPGPPWGPPPDRYRRPPAAFVLLAPVVISLLVQVPAAIGIAVWTHVGWATGLLQVALAVAGPLALLASRRFPGPTVAVVAGLALADLLVTPHSGPPYLAFAFAIVLAVARGAVVWAAVSTVVAWVGAIWLGSVLGLSWHPFRIAATTLALAACFGIGWFVRVRRTRAAAYREQALRRRRSAEARERVRIARELHDVIGHALSQINVQASVGLHLMDRDPEQARTALTSIKETSKTALDEVRSVLGVIRDGEAPLAPQAEIAELPRLLRGVESPDFSAELFDRLDEVPGRAAQFAAYRIVQEALTNVVRHAGATRALVELDHVGDELVVTIDDDGGGFSKRSSGDAVDEEYTGTGILGMRERATLLGGTVDLEASPLGGVRVIARLPWRAAA